MFCQVNFLVMCLFESLPYPYPANRGFIVLHGFNVYITTSRSHRLSVTYLVCFIRVTRLTGNANDFANAKSHAREKLLLPGYSLSDIIDHLLGFFIF